MVARPLLWGLALGGEGGVRAIIERLVRELAQDAAHADILDIRSIPRDILVPADQRAWSQASAADAASGGPGITG